MIKKEKICPMCHSSFEIEIIKETKDDTRIKKAYEQGKADAIDEFASVMNDLILSCGCYVSTAEVKKLAEQLKEQK